MSDLSQLEQQLILLLRGKHGSLSIKFNEEAAWNYASAAEVAARAPETFDRDWVSPEQREHALATNSVWTLQRYPDTPERYRRFRGASLAAVVEAAVQQMLHDVSSLN